MALKEGYTEHLFVYAGKVMGQKKIFCQCFLVIPGDGNHPDKLGDTLNYTFHRDLANRMVGGIYSGASFNADGGASGLNTAKFYGKWKDQEQLIKWQIRDKAVNAEKAAKKVEQDANVDELEQILLPLRKLYDRYHMMRRPDFTRELEYAVINALRTPPRQKEE